MLCPSLFLGLAAAAAGAGGGGGEERPGLGEGSHTVAHCTQPHSQPGEHLAIWTYPPPTHPFRLVDR